MTLMGSPHQALPYLTLPYPALTWHSTRPNIFPEKDHSESASKHGHVWYQIKGLMTGITIDE